MVGLVPHNRDSGKTRGSARTGRGRPGVLFNAARRAICHDPTMRVFHQLLVNNNYRAGKVAFAAVLRK